MSCTCRPPSPPDPATLTPGVWRIWTCPHGCYFTVSDTEPEWQPVTIELPPLQDMGDGIFMSSNGVVTIPLEDDDVDG
jgi:hypothetical protein